MTQTQPTKALDIGRVLRRGWAATMANKGVIFPLLLIWVAAPEAVLGLIGANGVDIGRSGDFVSGLLQLMATGGITHTLLAYFNGRTTTLGQSHQAASKLFAPLWGISLLCTLGIGLGLVLLVAPGLFLAAMWAVAVPARVADGPGVGAAMHRSRVLTEGNRWRVLGAVLVVLLPVIVAFFVVLLALGAAGLDENIVAVTVVTPLFSMAIALAAAVVAAALYAELTEGRGAAPELASIFD